ncbi:MAG: 16S rRNA (cytosine(1402)-N(4))-methyltransferase [Limosilactobacillus pontis]
MFRKKTSLSADLPSGTTGDSGWDGAHFKLVNKKPILPSAHELATNHRAHSAKLRIIEKIK